MEEWASDNSNTAQVVLALEEEEWVSVDKACQTLTRRIPITKRTAKALKGASALLEAVLSNRTRLAREVVTSLCPLSLTNSLWEA